MVAVVGMRVEREGGEGAEERASGKEGGLSGCTDVVQGVGVQEDAEAVGGGPPGRAQRPSLRSRPCGAGCPRPDSRRS